MSTATSEQCAAAGWEYFEQTADPEPKMTPESSSIGRTITQSDALAATAGYALRIEQDLAKIRDGVLENARSSMHDSGKRQQFEGGAMRDTADGKPDLSLISPILMQRLGHWLTLGAKKYAPYNWAKGMPVMRCVASLLRHVYAWVMKQEDEDHLAAAACNVMFLMHYDQGMKDGWMDKEKWDDRPDFRNLAAGTPPDRPVG